MSLPFSRPMVTAALAGGLLFTLVTACEPPAAVEGTVWVSTAPPPRVREVRPAPPGEDFIWIEGFHRWTGAQYEWVPGHWERRPDRHAKWKNGKWHHDNRGWYREEGHWKGRDD